MSPPLQPPPPAEPMGDAAAASDAHRAIPTPFLAKTYQLVEDPAIDDIISWNEDGSTFIVWRPAEFARDLLPKYFKHNNFSSFVRQLNTYGFRKIVPDRWEFANDNFRKGKKRLLCDIHRRKVAPIAAAVPVVNNNITVAVPGNRLGSQGNSGEELSSSSSSSQGATPLPSTRGGMATTTSTAAELTNENERLRKENIHLSNEISQMKKLCDKILFLMSKYTISEKEWAGGVNAAGAGSKGRRGEEKTELPAPPLPIELVPLELMPMNSSVAAEWPTPDAAKLEELSRSMRLFGVHIDGKRPREDENCAGEQYQKHRRVPEVKSEPMDQSPDLGDGPEQPWLLYSCLANQRVCN